MAQRTHQHDRPQRRHTGVIGRGTARAGVVLITSLLFLVLLGVLSTASLTRAMTDLLVSQRTVTLAQLFYVAEATVDTAMWQFQLDAQDHLWNGPQSATVTLPAGTGTATIANTNTPTKPAGSVFLKHDTFRITVTATPAIPGSLPPQQLVVDFMIANPYLDYAAQGTGIGSLVPGVSDVTLDDQILVQSYNSGWGQDTVEDYLAKHALQPGRYPINKADVATAQLVPAPAPVTDPTLIEVLNGSTVNGAITVQPGWDPSTTIKVDASSTVTEGQGSKTLLDPLEWPDVKTYVDQLVAAKQGALCMSDPTQFVSLTLIDNGDGTCTRTFTDPATSTEVLTNSDVCNTDIAYNGHYCVQNITLDGPAVALTSTSAAPGEAMAIYLSGKLTVTNDAWLGAKNNLDGTPIPGGVIIAHYEHPFSLAVPFEIMQGGQVYGVLYVPKHTISAHDGAILSGAVIAKQVMLQNAVTLNYDVSLINLMPLLPTILSWHYADTSASPPPSPPPPPPSVTLN